MAQFNFNKLVLPAFTLGIIALLYFVFKSVLVYLIISAVLSVIGSPLVELFMKIKGKKFAVGRGLASLLTLLVFYTIIAVGVSTVLPSITQEAKYLSQIDLEKSLTALEAPLRSAEVLIHEYTGQEFSIKNYAQEKLTSVISFGAVSNWLNAITGFTGGLLLSFFAISFITFFFMKDGKMFLGKFKTLFPSKYRQEAQDLYPEIRKKLTRYLIGICCESLVIFICLAIGLYLLDIKYFVIIAIVAATVNVIPYIGPIIGMIFGVTVTAVVQCTGTVDCLDFIFPVLGGQLLLFIAVQLLDNILLQPLIYGKSVNAHPLEIFLVVIISGNFFGIVGMIAAIPTWSVAKIIFAEIRKDSGFLASIYGDNSNSENG